MDIICQDGFMDDKYLDEDIPDEFFQQFAPVFKQNPTIVVLKQPVYINETVSSVFAEIDYYEQNIITGVRDGFDVAYTIEHDIGNVDPVLEWYEKFEKGVVEKFPYFLPSMPVFPPKALQEVKYYRIQKTMMNKGFALANPTFSELSNCSGNGLMYSESCKGDLDLPMKEIGINDKLFFAYKDFRKIYTNKQVGMQFNPFHPRSLKLLKNVFQIGKVFRGVYLWGTKEIQFEYDLDDDRYRIHADVWLNEWLGFEDYHAECYDFVGNYDFLEDVLFRIDVTDYIKEDGNYNVKDHDDIRPLMVEPYNTTRRPLKQYSAIGPWEGKIEIGMSHMFRVPYMTKSIRSNDYKTENTESYIDVTNLTEAANSLIKIRNCCEKCWSTKYFNSPFKCECEGIIKRIDRKKIYSKNDGFFVRDYGDGYRVYKQADYGYILFNKFHGRLIGMPTDGKYSLVYPFTIMTLIALVSDENKMLLGDIFQLSFAREMLNIIPEIAHQEDMQSALDDGELTELDFQNAKITRHQKRYEVTDFSESLLRKIEDYITENDIEYEVEKGKVTIIAEQINIDAFIRFYSQELEVERNLVQRVENKRKGLKVKKKKNK